MGRAYQNRKESMAKTADAKTKVYSKYGREIYMCAKSGGIDPDGNLSLRSMIDRAKKDQVPGHVIEKAIEKAKGGAGEDFATARYEGFGPGNCMVIVDCLTDNPNRTFGDVRQCFTKTKSKIGAQGSVGHMFDHSAIFVFKSEDEDTALEALMEADVDVSDIECENGEITIFAPNTDYFKAKQALNEAFGTENKNGEKEVDFKVDEIQFVPQTTTEISGDDIATFETFLDMLNDLDDVQNVYHSAEF
ncbi:transcriptional regulator [Oleiphilus sp. HI0078]|jgi:YebC/PmpR family DNA-binding regulatory protein|nr:MULTISPECIES: YebC/PmpR family DNA-binding transcriptional regulator [unclassified Oleiphilus]KZY76581.1 transcriptional regulator [Oleiphilus sp. HI0068]KZY78675.1 transcriptional regulator [Oleiphilus sp. HI0069]KZY87360.1 transcriptional regulator [Oleiphilus sp. HI0072]KZZ16942.1 transcriptional regulator [Oleiphilus sp. HI0078]KZZ38426.1 transcriptional regulator [Oleiphilus sp. HI0085]